LRAQWTQPVAPPNASKTKTPSNASKTKTEPAKAAVVFPPIDPERAAALWDKGFKRLQEYKKEYGHCRVPSKLKRWQDLYHWIRQQKKRRYGSFEGLPQLTESELEQLKEVGLTWSGSAWEKNYLQLQKFKEENGHTRVPQTKEWSTLYKWLHNSKRRKDGPYGDSPQLTEEQVEKLSELGVDWKGNRSWYSSFQELEVFYMKHGHCRVPYTKKEELRLYNWLRHQKRRAKKLDPDQVELLKSVGAL